MYQHEDHKRRIQAPNHKKIETLDQGIHDKRPVKAKTPAAELALTVFVPDPAVLLTLGENVKVDVETDDNDDEKERDDVEFPAVSVVVVVVARYVRM